MSAARSSRSRVCSKLGPLATAVAVALAGTAPAGGQDALALSGGGSRGFAHAGALIALERLGYSPGIVVGTSMGAVIGALYAAGMPADSIARVAIETDWVALFSPFEPAIGPTLEPRVPLLQLRLGGGGRAATGLISDWRINRLLARLLYDAGARARSDFDSLPRRFRAVAADLATGVVVRTRSGDLARAVRASMAVPGVFAPVAEGERLLVDGGIASYLPVMTARELGGVGVIAVDVIRPPREIRATDPFTVALRGFRLTLWNAMRDASPPAFLIAPDIPQRVSAAYFARSPQRLIDLGLEATLATMPRAGAPVPPPAPPSPPSVLRELVVEGGGLTALARSAFERVPLDRHDPAAVFAALDRLYATGRFAGVWPRVDRGPDGDVLIARVDPVARSRLAGAAALDTDRGPAAWLSLRHRPGRGALEAAASVSMGSFDKLVSAELGAPVAAVAGAALTVGGAWRERDLRIFEEGRHAGERDVSRSGAWLGIEWRSVGRDLHGALAVRAERIASDGGDGWAVGPFLRLSKTGTPARIVGAPFILEAEARYGDIPYRRGRVAGSLDAPAGPLLVALSGEISVTGGDPPLDAWLALGDRHALPGLRWGEERGRAGAVGGVDVAHPFLLGAWVRLRGRAGFTGDALRDGGSARWIGGGEGGLVWETPLGGIAATAGASTRGDWRLHFSIGPEF